VDGPDWERRGTDAPIQHGREKSWKRIKKRFLAPAEKKMTLDERGFTKRKTHNARKGKKRGLRKGHLPTGEHRLGFPGGGSRSHTPKK